MEGRLIEVRLYIYLAKLSINICDATVRKKSAFKAQGLIKIIHTTQEQNTCTSLIIFIWMIISFAGPNDSLHKCNSVDNSVGNV